MRVSKIVDRPYRYVIARALLAPSAYFLDWKDRLPLTFSLLVQFFLLALCGETQKLTEVSVSDKLEGFRAKQEILGHERSYRHRPLLLLNPASYIMSL